MSNANDILKKIAQHKELLEKAIEHTQTLKECCLKNEEERIIEVTQNRDIMINDLVSFQDKICQDLEKIPAKLLSNNIISQVKSWNDKVTVTINTIHTIDQEIVGILENQKGQLTKEIASTFKSRTSIGGYNLENVKRK